MIIILVLSLLVCASPVAAQMFQWTQLPGAPGGYGHVLGEGEGVFFATTMEGKIYRSVNQGSTWDAPIHRLQGISMGAFATDGPFTYIGTSKGIYRSDDPGLYRGLSWNNVFVPTGEGAITALAAHDSIVVAVVDGLVYSSIDAGNNWREGPRIAEGTINPSIAITNSALFVLGVEGSQPLYRSDDSGRSWSPAPSSGLTLRAVAAADSMMIAITTEAPGIYHSTDNGAEWRPDTLSGGYIAAGLKRTGRGILAFGEYDAYEWERRSGSWRHINPMGRIGSIAGGQSGYMVGNPLHGLSRSSSGDRGWERINSPDLHIAVHSLDMLEGLLIAETDDIFQSADGGTWRGMELPYPESQRPPRLNAIVNVKGIIIAALKARVVRSTDGGKGWTDAFAGMENTRVADLAVRDTTVFAATFNGIYRSSDRGESWEPTSEGITDNLIKHSLVNGEWIYAVTSSAVFRSSDNGATWIEGGYGLPAGSLGRIATAGPMLVMITRDGLYRSADAGGEWRKSLNHGLPLGPDTESASLITVGSRVVVGYGSSVYVSIDYGDTWTGNEILIDSLPVMITALTYFNGALHVGTAGDGIFRGESSFLSAAHVDTDRNESSLLECLPNPASGAMAIRYTVETPGNAELTILDALGNRLATIPDAPGETGTHTVRFNTALFPAGVYYCQLRIAGRRHTTPVVVTR